MSLTKNQLRDLKKKMLSKDSNSLNNIRKKSPKVIKSTIKKENFKQKTSVIRWNFEVNELVNITTHNEIGLIISNFEYFSKRVEKNSFFILVGNSVRQIDGKFLRRF
tara:strand:- start:210 stop:530 length:321 start_codon:yes stop_codon:yes gene_type:complete